MIAYLSVAVTSMVGHLGRYTGARGKSDEDQNRAVNFASDAACRLQSWHGVRYLAFLTPLEKTG